MFPKYTSSSLERIGESILDIEKMALPGVKISVAKTIVAQLQYASTRCATMD